MHMVPVHQAGRYPFAATAQSAHHLELIKDGSVEFLSQFRHSLLHNTSVAIIDMTTTSHTQAAVVIGNEQEGSIGVYSQYVVNQFPVVGLESLCTKPAGRHIGIINSYAEDYQIRRAQPFQLLCKELASQPLGNSSTVDAALGVSNPHPIVLWPYASQNKAGAITFQALKDNGTFICRPGESE